MAQKVVFKAVVQDSGLVLADRVSIADSPMSRAKGLLGRRGIEDGEGLLIRPCSSIHTFFMNFPIDVLFLTRDGRVLKAAMGLRPWRLSGCWFGCYMVLELKEGVIEKTEVLKNKSIKFV